MYPPTQALASRGSWYEWDLVEYVRVSGTWYAVFHHDDYAGIDRWDSGRQTWADMSICCTHATCPYRLDQGFSCVEYFWRHAAESYVEFWLKKLAPQMLDSDEEPTGDT